MGMQGTGPFMAIEVLDTAGKSQIKQTPAHDLESVFYVLLYICLLFKGPGNMTRTKEDLQEYPSMAINTWFDLYPRFRDLADVKRGQLASFERRFLNKFAPYFHNLRTCVVALWDVIFPPVHVIPGQEPLRDVMSCSATHTKVLEILRDTYNKLPLEEDTTMLAAAPSKRSKRNTNDPDEQTRVAKRRATDRDADSSSQIQPGSSHGTHSRPCRSVSAHDAQAHRPGIPRMSRRSISATDAARNESQIFDSGVHMVSGSHGMTRRSSTRAAQTGKHS